MQPQPIQALDQPHIQTLDQPDFLHPCCLPSHGCTACLPCKHASTRLSSWRHSAPAGRQRERRHAPGATATNWCTVDRYLLADRISRQVSLQTPADRRRQLLLGSQGCAVSTPVSMLAAWQRSQRDCVQVGRQQLATPPPPPLALALAGLVHPPQPLPCLRFTSRPTVRCHSDAYLEQQGSSRPVWLPRNLAPAPNRPSCCRAPPACSAGRPRVRLSNHFRPVQGGSGGHRQARGVSEPACSGARGREGEPPAAGGRGPGALAAVHLLRPAPACCLPRAATSWFP